MRLCAIIFPRQQRRAFRQSHKLFVCRSSPTRTTVHLQGATPRKGPIKPGIC